MRYVKRAVPVVLATLLTASASAIFINSSGDLKYYSDENLSVRITNSSEIILPSDDDPAGNQDVRINLSQVLTAGNRPGDNDIDLAGQDLRRVDGINPIGVTNLNISSNTSFQNNTVVNVSVGGPDSLVDKEYVDFADAFVGDNQTLDEVLDIGNSAGNNDIFLNDNNLTDTGNLTTNTSLKLGKPGKLYLPEGGPVKSSDTVLGNLSQVLKGGNGAGQFDILLNDNDLEEVNALNSGQSQNITVGVGLKLRNNTIRNLSEPTQPGQAANKQYVDSSDKTVADNQNLEDVLAQGRSAGVFDINLTGQEITDTEGSITLGGGNVDIPDGDLDMGGNSIDGIGGLQDCGPNEFVNGNGGCTSASDPVQFTNINDAGGDDTTISSVDEVRVDEGAGLRLESPSPNTARLSLGSHWKTIYVDGTPVLTPSGQEPLNLATGDGLTVTGDSTTDPQKLTFSVNSGNILGQADDLDSDGRVSDFSEATDLGSGGDISDNSVQDAELDLANGLTVAGGAAGDGTQNGLEVDDQGNLYLSGSLNFPGDVNTVNAQELEGSFVPSQDAQFNIGSSSSRWKNGYFSGRLNVETNGAEISDDTGTSLDVQSDGDVVVTLG